MYGAQRPPPQEELGGLVWHFALQGRQPLPREVIMANHNRTLLKLARASSHGLEHVQTGFKNSISTISTRSRSDDKEEEQGSRPLKPQLHPFTPRHSPTLHLSLYSPHRSTHCISLISAPVQHPLPFLAFFPSLSCLALNSSSLFTASPVTAAFRSISTPRASFGFCLS